MSLTALIIDDEPLARQELQYLLERAGGVDILAQGTNGIEAVELIRTHKPDLVFLDVQMPGLDGFGVLKSCSTARCRFPRWCLLRRTTSMLSAPSKSMRSIIC